MAPGQFGTGQFGTRTIWHQTFDMIKLNLKDHFWQNFGQKFSFGVIVCPFGHKLSWCQVVRCQIVRFYYVGAKLSWCQIVRCQIVLVPNCPGAKLSDAKLSGAKLSYHVFSSSSILQSIYKEFGSPYNKARFACFVLHSRLFENSIFVFEQIL